MTQRRAITIIAATSLALGMGACAGVGGRLTFNDTEKVKITDIVLDGRSGDITIRTAAISETHITRTIRSTVDPQTSYRVDGTTLHLDTRCGRDCSVSYEVEAPAGVNVRGDLTSGTVQLTDVATADVELTSGDVLVKNATGTVRVKATSGDITVDGAKAATTLLATSGDIRGVNLAGPISAKVTSGDMSLQLSTPGPVTAEVASGDLNLTVPTGTYQVRTHQGSGEVNLGDITTDNASRNILDLRAGSGDVTVGTA